MASRMFLKLGSNIKGESTDSAHKEWIEILSFAHGVAQPVSAASATGGRTGGGASFSDFSVTKIVDSASPDILVACAQGTHIDKVEIEVCQVSGDGTKPHCYLRYELGNTIISSVSPAGSGGGDKPMESISLNYGTIKQKYTPIDSLGKAGTAVERGWDLEKNAKM